jgi:hypothetical protein
MKPKLYDAISILLDISADFDHQNRIIPKDTEGTIVECYENPDMYAIDLAIPNERLIGGFEYENVILSPEQFVVVDRELPRVGLRKIEFFP